MLVIMHAYLEDDGDGELTDQLGNDVLSNALFIYLFIALQHKC